MRLRKKLLSLLVVLFLIVPSVYCMGPMYYLVFNAPNFNYEYAYRLGNTGDWQNLNNGSFNALASNYSQDFVKLVGFGVKTEAHSKTLHYKIEITPLENPNGALPYQIQLVRGGTVETTVESDKNKSIVFDNLTMSLEFNPNEYQEIATLHMKLGTDSEPISNALAGTYSSKIIFTVKDD